MIETEVFFPLLIGKINVIGYKINSMQFKSKADFEDYQTKFRKNHPYGVLIDVNKEEDGQIECLTTDSIFNFKRREVTRIYDTFSNLGISEDLSKELSEKDKSIIIKFLAKYSMLRFNQEHLEDHTNLIRARGKLIDIFFFFIPFEEKTKRIAGFFKEFQLQYLSFRDLIKRIVEEKESIDNLKGAFDEHLKHIYPVVYFQTDKNDKKALPIPAWQARTLLDWCYFELYVSVLKNEGSKTCKYCGGIFFSNKNNRVCCDLCRGESKTQYKKRWYEKNKPREQRKARERMKKLRKIEKKQKTNI